VLKKLFEAIGDDRPLPTIYGGLVAIAFFGPKAVDAFVVPLAIRYWNEWAASLDKTTSFLARFEIQQCQQAILVSFVLRSSRPGRLC
jgi:TAF6 C-terminal HEAT repeat domain